MKNLFVCFAAVVTVFFVGCNSIGNGTAKNMKMTFDAPEYIDIEGDWRIEIVKDAKENSCEIVLDENLVSRLSVRTGRKLGIYLDDGIFPMVAPVLRIKLVKPFNELSIEGNSTCNISGFKFVTPLEAELSDRAVCFFNKCEAQQMTAEVSEHAKLSFKGSINELEAEIEDRAVLEADNVEKFILEGSDNSICRIKSCKNAELELEDSAYAEFRQVEKINYSAEDAAAVKYPVVIPESLKKGKKFFRNNDL